MKTGPSSRSRVLSLVELAREESMRGAIFVLPISARQRSGPLAPWVTTAGWAGAAERRWGTARVVTPDGTFTPDEALVRGTEPIEAAPSSSPGWRRWIPQTAATAVKDVMKRRTAKDFRDQVLAIPVEDHTVPLVWQRHLLFQTAGIDLARQLDVPCVLSVHAPYVREARSWGTARPGWGSWLEKVGEGPQLRAADIVACVSDEVGAFVAEYGIDDTRIVITPNGVDTEHFRPGEKDPKLMAALGLEGHFVVGWTGSIKKFQSIELVVEAVAEVQRHVPNVALLLVGGGHGLEDLIRLATQLGIQKAVFTGTVPHADLPEYIRLMDVTLLVTEQRDYHYSPVKLRGYLATGRPVVAPNVGEMSRTLTHGQDVILVESGSPGLIADAIRNLHADPGLRSRLSDGARTKAIEDMSWDTVLDRTVDALERVRG